LSDLTAVTFKLIFEVEINRKEKREICMGSQVFMPTFNEKGIAEDVMVLKLNKGPGENYENELLISEESVSKDLNVFDIVLQGQVS
jgi:hypothetical protein